MKRALTLAGGGAKGVYEIGVYKALIELGYEFNIITGTSIGAVNGAMLVQGDYTLATELWESLTMSKVMGSGGLALGEGKSLDYYVEHREALLPLLKNYIATRGIDISPFKALLAQYLNEEKFFRSATDFGLITVHFPTLFPREITKDKIAPGYLEKWVLASASCFPAFPVCEIDGHRYIDGMYYDNVPIDTAFRMGAGEVIAVTLKPATTQNKNKYEAHPLVTYIEPSHPLGMALAFENETLMQNKKLGYYDAMKTCGSYYGNAYTFLNSHDHSYELLAKDITKDVMRLEVYDTPEQQRVAKLRVPGQTLNEYLDKMRVSSRHDNGTYFACLIETYMNLFQYDIYQPYNITTVIKDLLAKANSKSPDPTMTTVLQAVTEFETSVPIETLLKKYEPDTVITALLLKALLA